MAFLPVLAAVGAGISAVSTVAGGFASKNAAEYQASVSRNNAIIAEQNAVRAEQAGGVQAENQSRKGAAKLATIKTSQGANNVNVNTGSALDVQVGEREVSQLDTETVMANADLKAWGYRRQAENFESEAALSDAKAESAVPASLLSATGSLLSNASSIGGGKFGSWSTKSSGDAPNYAPDDI